jgi:hypothetical protein
VSFALEHPDDVTIYLGDGLLPIVTRWEIVVGNGKSARAISMDNAVLGSVLHVVAQSIVVRTSVTAAAALTGRLHAAAGLGRPTRQVLRQYVSNVPPSGSIDLPAPPFAATMLIYTDDTTNSLSVQPRYVFAPFNNSVGPTEPIANWKPERPTNPLANTYRILNADAVNVHSAQVTWYGIQ